MPTITIRNLEESTKQLLRKRAASHGRSMEEEARRILRQAVQLQLNQKGLASKIHQRFELLGGVELELPARSGHRPPPSLEDFGQ